MSVSQACNYALTALQQEFSACGKAPSSNATTDCNCTSLDPESVNAYCNFPENDRNTWTTSYSAAVDARMNACLAVNKPVVPATVIALPSDIPNPWAVQTGPLTPACNYILTGFGQRFRNCGKGPDTKAIDTCICTGLYTESLLAYCDLPGNDKSSWFNDYQSGVSTRATSCANVGLSVQPIPLVPLPNNIPNPIKDAPTPAPLTPACNYVLDAFGQRFRNCGKGADAASANTCICTGLFTESLLAYCDLPGNDKSKWFSDYQSGVSARADSCAKVGLALTPIPLLSLPDNIPNPLKDTSASTSTSVVAPSPIPPTKTTSAAADAKTSTPSKPTTVVGSGAGSIGLGGALVLAVAVLI
ncbi:hypothetical protein BCR33DRAFT_728203 [Rhizoclosmatium globosum]|uniref:Uncharacterized protein n=1 Tax=Rhizoclosmatium globosum TaxID=329046 RepID=A0A1Y2AL02_9FUNG|nr:hypothetical protein BCR33DRAFT_728203 [Rhizoclosmatium globosum]|eukprot:ORY23186.1 hypothetical protein BCR33DRAFT_728203 [Rhizoclosmatium globosum]